MSTPPTKVHPHSPPRSAGDWSRAFRGWGRSVVVGVLLLVTLAVVSRLNPAFATAENMRDLLVQAAPVVIVGCGMTFVVLTGEIDISVGSLMGLLAALMGILASPRHAGLPPVVVVGVVLLAGAGFGLFNGLLVTIGRVPSIIATLGMLTLLKGVTQLALAGVWITDLPSGIRWFGTAAPFGVPLCLWVAGVVAIASMFIARHTRFGLCIYAVGDNPTAAAFARISPVLVKLCAFALVGLLTAVATVVTVPQLSVIESEIGSGLELVVVTAVVVGGTAIRGGRGGITGTVLAALLLGSIRTILVFLSLGVMATYWERAIQGAFILVAVLADHFAAARQGRDEAPGAQA